MEGKTFQLPGPGCAKVTTRKGVGTQRRQMGWLRGRTGFGGTTSTGWLPKTSTSISKERCCVFPKVTATPRRGWDPGILPPDTVSTHSLWGTFVHTQLPHLLDWQLFSVPMKRSKSTLKTHATTSHQLLGTCSIARRNPYASTLRTREQKVLGPYSIFELRNRNKFLLLQQ